MSISGFEPATQWSEIQHATAWLLRPYLEELYWSPRVYIWTVCVSRVFDRQYVTLNWNLISGWSVLVAWCTVSQCVDRHRWWPWNKTPITWKMSTYCTEREVCTYGDYGRHIVRNVRYALMVITVDILYGTWGMHLWWLRETYCTEREVCTYGDYGRHIVWNVRYALMVITVDILYGTWGMHLWWLR